MSNDVNAIFDKVPMEESTPTGTAKTPSKDSFKMKGDQKARGDVSDRIEAFGDLVEEDEYGEDNQREYEPVKVEKDKTPESRDETEKKTEGKGTKNPDDKKSDETKEEVKEPKEEVNFDDDNRTVKVKIDGKEIEVPLKDLKADYSGKQAISKRFNEFNKEKLAFEKTRKQYDADINNIQSEVSELRSGFESVVNEYKKNGFLSKSPMHTVNTLLDKLGINSYDFERAMFEHQLPEYAKFFDMSEVEQDAYFAKRENEFLRKRDQSLAERTQAAQASTARQQEEFNLIKNAGLTSEKYNELFEELEALGDEEISVEKVVEFSRIKPSLDRAGEIISKTKKSGDTNLIGQVASLLMQYPQTTEEEIISHIDGSAVGAQMAKDLKDKEDFTVKTRPKKSATAFTEEDEDFDMEMFKTLRR